MHSKYVPHRARKLLVVLLFVGLMSFGLWVALALAIDLPPVGSIAFLQTTGPNAGLNIGDWYTNVGGGNRPHNFRILVPCTVPPNQTFTVELFDPEIFAGAQAPDEIRGGADDATFTLLAPDGTVVATTTYPPAAATNDQFVTFATFTSSGSGCGEYTLLVETSDNDDNGWSLRVTPDDPDGTPGSGDELLLASFETSFQYPNPGCQDFFFFVPMTNSIRLNNFDLDGNQSVTYFLPDGSTDAGTVSGGTVWNNGGAGHPPPGGDDIIDPDTGWWRAEVCANANNQYIFEPEGLIYFFQQPPVPEMTVNKDDGQTLVLPGQTITYTISFTNIGNGAAVDVTLNDTLPASTTFVSCGGGFPCGEVAPPGSGVATYSLGIVEAGTGGQVTLGIRLDDNFPSDSTLTNTVELDYADTLGNSYPPEEATDVNQTPLIGPDLTLNKSDGGITTAPGAVIPYTLAYANVSPTDATGVVITDTVPANATFNEAASGPTVWSCPDGSPAGTICTTDLGPVPGNSNGTVDFAVNVNDPLPAGVTTITNTARIGDDGLNGPDPTPDNNQSTETTPIVLGPPPELQLTKGANVANTVAGEPIIYILTYGNTSTTGATGVLITETVPTATSFDVAASAPTAWSCPDGSSGGTTCVTIIGPLPGNSSGTANFAVTVNNPVPAGVTAIVNSATIGDDGANGTEANQGNNTDANTIPLSGAGGAPPPAGSPGGDDDDDDSGASPSAPASSTSTVGTESLPAPEPTPTLPVILLPETGSRAITFETVPGAGFWLLVGLGVTAVVLLYRRKWGQRTNDN